MLTRPFKRQTSTKETPEKAREEKLLSDIMTIENEKRTLVDQYETLNTQYKETMAALVAVKENDKVTTEQLAQARLDIINLEATIKNTNRQLAEAHLEVDEAKQNMENQKQQHLGSQNAALHLQALHQDQLSRLRDSHTKDIATLTDEHEKFLKNEKEKLTKQQEKAISTAIAAEKVRCQKQRDTDAATWKKEKQVFDNTCRINQDNELRTMKDIFNKQFEELKAALQSIKGEAMETDNESKLLKKIEEQSEIIISLRQTLQIKQEIATQETQKDADPELCSAYNNFVTFITHVKNLKITDALRTVPNSIASLITFLFTLLGTKLVNHGRYTPSFNRNRNRSTTTTNRHTTELQTIQPTSTWRFGDGPLLASVNSILHEALPKIVLFVNHTPILTLVDTGASINVISSRIFRQLPSTTVLEVSCNDATATSANGTKLLLSQKAIIKLTIDNATYTITCYVSPKIDHDLILGRPGLEAIGDLKISWAKGAIQIGEHNLQLRNTYPLALDEEVILEPRSHNVLTPSIRHAPPSIGKEHVFPIVDPYVKGTSALVTYQQVNPVFDNKINLLIDNCGNNPVRLPRNTILGHVALVEKINCHEIKITNEGYSDDEADIVERLPPYPKNKPPSELSIKDLRKLVRVDQQELAGEDQAAFYKILWQYRECFYEFNPTPAQYTGPEKLQLQTIPHNLPKPIRHARYTIEKENEIAKQVNDMLQNDMIEPSRTPYLSRINLIKKKNDEWRFVVDFRLINKLIQAQSHHIPRIDSILDKAAGKKYYTSLDLKNGFHQLTLDKSSRHLTGFPTHMGIFQYKRIPMGLVGSPDFFNHVMEKIFSTSNNFVYLDDILITSNTAAEHLLYISRALAKAVEVGLRFSLSKCSFFQTSLEYLGFIVSRNGITPNPNKTKALHEKPIPTNEKELRAFLGAANYYRKFIPYYSNTAAPLYDIINNFVWTSNHTEAFTALKRSILRAVTLAAPDPQEPYTIFTDASTQGLGAALVQNGRPIAFASRTLRKAETLYAPVQLEALGLVYALKQFNPYIYGKRTTIQTDQKSLLSLMTKKDVSNILDRYKTYIMGYDLDIKYVKGADNTVADYLSRQVYNINLTETTEDFSDVFPKVTSYLQYPFVLGNFSNYMDEKENEEFPDCFSTQRGRTRKYVPKLLRFMTLTLWHEHPLLGNHTGYDKGAAKFKDTFHWPAMDVDIKRVWSSCIRCLQCKPHGPLQATVNEKSNPTPPHTWHTLSIDYLSYGYNDQVLTLIDDFSKFVRLHYTKNQTAQTTVDCLKNTFYLLGFPAVIRTDNGPAFVSDTFKEFCDTFGIEHSVITAHNHQGIAIVERFNRTIRESLRLYKEHGLQEIILHTQYAHNFSNMTNQEGKPKEFILSTTDKFTNEQPTHGKLSGRQDLLEFIKQSLTEKPAEQDPLHIPNGTIVFKKNSTAHKNDDQFTGPYKICEHIYGDTYLMVPVSKYHRQNGPPERTNSRFLKIAPKEAQKPANKEDTRRDMTSRGRGRGRPRRDPIVSQPPPSKDNNVTFKRGRGRPRKY